MRPISMQTLTLLASLVLGACGGDGSSAPPPSASSPQTPTPSPTATASSTGMPASQVAAQIGPCVNMANQLEAPNEGDWGRPIADDDFVQIAKVGFTTVRIPTRWSAHAGAAPPYTIDPAFMARVDHVVGLARASGLRVILDMHHYDELFADPAAGTERFTALWRQIAEHFQYADTMVWFELINEPHDRLDDTNLAAVLTPALAAVRETNPTRKIVFGGENYSGVNSLASVPLPADPNIIVTFHYYDPFAFTHQGATFLSSPPPVGRAYPIGNDVAQLAADVNKVKTFMARTGVPVFLGEYGAYDGIALNQRAAYYKAVHDAFAGAYVDGCVWGYTNSFAFRVGDSWQEPLLQAIGL